MALQPEQSKKAPAPQKKRSWRLIPNPVREWVNFTGLLASIFLVLSIWYRWLRPDPDFLGFTTAIAELLALASFLGLQTEGGKQLAVKLDNSIGVGRWLNRPERVTRAIWSVTVLLAVFLFAGSPLAARVYRERGVTALEQGDFSQAIQRFKKAASLEPENAHTHFNLGSAYEELHEYETAVQEYLLSLELDDQFWPAHNNLGRLFLTAQDDPVSALAVLQTGQWISEDPLADAVIGKNAAWAYIELGYYASALEELESVQEALDALVGQGSDVGVYQAETYRLLALVYEAQGETREAKRAWQDCLGASLAIAESAVCTKGGTRTPLHCLNVFLWEAEAREALLRFE